MKIKNLIEIIVLGLIVNLAPAMCQAAIQPENIEIANGKISVNLFQAPFQEVITKISERQG
jgi:hypothetical protein